MKKRIIKISVCLSVVALATIGVKMANSEQISSIGLAFSNMEALAADGEAGAKGKACSFGKQFSGKEYNIAYECTNRGRNVCIIWKKYIQLGASEGYCTNAQ